MKTKMNAAKLMALALVASTATGIALFPTLKQAQAIPAQTPPKIVQHTTQEAPTQAHRIEAVFILDTTSSMSGLIQAAKEKIWSIASTMASAQQNPDIKIGLVAFRDRGDTYITKVFDLSDDLDSMYASLMEFKAQGGGDGPESVNQALYDAVHNMSWSHDSGVYKVAFLVGDAPPHMDYQNDVQYPITLKAAANKGIIVNAIQSGQNAATLPAWQRIATLGNGAYFQVEHSGNAITIATPYDEQISQLAAKLEETRLYYGNEETKQAQKRKLEANAKLRKALSPSALARRDVYNATVSGKKNLLGKGELVDAITSGTVELGDINQADMPAALQALEPKAQMAVISERAKRRDQLDQEIKKLTQSRNRYIQEKVEAEGGVEGSLDEKIYGAVKEQASSVGLTYESDRARY